MADKNTRIKREQVEPLRSDDLDAINVPEVGQIPALGSGGQFEWIDIVESHTAHSDDQTSETVPTTESGVSVQDKLTELENTIPEVDNFTIINNAGILKIADRIEINTILAHFYRQVDQSKIIYNLTDGFIDEYEDETGIDTINSINESYDSLNDLYSPSIQANKEIDYIEYTTDELVRNTYISSDFLPSGIDEYTVLCSHFNGNDGATAYSDPIVGAYTFHGSAQLDTAQKVFGSASLLLTPATSDYLTIGDNALTDFGTSDFTIELRIRFNALDTWQTFIGQQKTAGDYFQLGRNGNYLRIYISNNSETLLDLQNAWTPSTDTWYHVAVVRHNNDWLMFINGTQIGTTNTTSLTFPNYDLNMYIGAFIDGINNLTNGWIEELRISKGTARWTSNFTPPTSEYSESDTGNLLNYSEASIKNQGSYSMKAVALITDSLNDTLTKTLESGSHIDLSGYNTIKLDIRSSRTGQNLQLQIHDSGGTTSTYNITINSANTWETKTWDISGISDANKNDIDLIVIKITNADAENTFYIDNIYGVGLSNNMTLFSNIVTAEVEPSNIRIVLFEEDVDTIILNTDFKAYASIDNGSNYDQIILTDMGNYESSKRILSGIIDVSARTGISIKYKLEILNNKNCKIKGTGLNWA